MKKLGDLITPSLTRKARLLEIMSESARTRLPKEIASHCWVGGFEKDHIVLVTDYPHYVTYLRCHQREILKQLKEEFRTYVPENVRRVRIRISRVLS